LPAVWRPSTCRTSFAIHADHWSKAASPVVILSCDGGWDDLQRVWGHATHYKMQITNVRLPASGGIQKESKEIGQSRFSLYQFYSPDRVQTC
jgi:hypothetical protein